MPQPARLPPSQRHSNVRPIWAAGGLAALALAVYATSFRGEFVFDDVPSIVQNQAIRQVPSAILPQEETAITARPVISLSFGLNYACGGLDPWGFHAVNLAIHLASALLLMGIVRRTLLLERWQGRFERSALPLAAIIAAVWLVHPLQTSAVTYIIQRMESLMSLFYLLSLYAVIRGATAGRGAAWYVVAIVACLLGAGCKASIVTAPVVILLYDAIFLAGSAKDLIRRRWWLYLGLATSWVAIAALMILRPRTQSVGFDLGCTWWQYARSEFGVVLHYLRLAAWPRGLCLDYSWPVTTVVADIVWPALAIAALLAGTAALLWKRPAWGFAAAWVFLILAPTSTVIPVASELAVEHRMYLPLAGIVTLAVLGAYILICRLSGTTSAGPRWPYVAGGVLALAVTAALGVATAQRNVLYHRPAWIWQDAVDAFPQGWRPQFHLAMSLPPERLPEVIEHYSQAARLNPRSSDAFFNLGMALNRADHYDDGLACFQKVVELDANSDEAVWNCGWSLALKGDLPGALALYRRAMAMHTDAHRQQVYDRVLAEWKKQQAKPK